jgi:hypothetical protein
MTLLHCVVNQVRLHGNLPGLVKKSFLSFFGQIGKVIAAFIPIQHFNKSKKNKKLFLKCTDV